MRLNHFSGVPGGVAAQADSDRQAGNVGGVGEDVDGQRGHGAAHILRADAQPVDPVENFALHVGVEQLLIVGEQVAAQRLFGKQGGHLAVAADAHADNQRGARFAAVFLYAAHHIADDVLAGGAGVEHPQAAGVFASRALRNNGERNAVALHQPHMDDGGGVVPGVNPVERVIDHRLAQVSLVVSLTHALVDGVLEQLARDVHILTDLGKDHHHAGVLADGQAGVLGCLVVFDDAVQRTLAIGRNFIVARGVQRELDVRRQKFIGAQAEIFDCTHNGFGCNRSHHATPLRFYH